MPILWHDIFFTVFGYQQHQVTNIPNTVLTDNIMHAIFSVGLL